MICPWWWWQQLVGQHRHETMSPRPFTFPSPIAHRPSPANQTHLCSLRAPVHRQRLFHDHFDLLGGVQSVDVLKTSAVPCRVSANATAFEQFLQQLLPGLLIDSIARDRKGHLGELQLSLQHCPQDGGRFRESWDGVPEVDCIRVAPVAETMRHRCEYPNFSKHVLPMLTNRRRCHDAGGGTYTSGKSETARGGALEAREPTCNSMTCCHPYCCRIQP